MRNNSLSLSLLIYLLLILAISGNSSADRMDISGNTSLWWNIYEQNENGILQARTGEQAADVASGFSIRQARVGLDYQDAQKTLEARIQIRLEERVSMLDTYIAWRPSEIFNLQFGQMKIPATYEVLTNDAELDFISRTTLSKILPDWSLSRAAYYSALYGIRSYNRDLGIGISGKISTEYNPALLSYFAMLGNGLGANLFVGGKENKEFIFANKIGSHFYGMRLDASPVKFIRIGGHYCINRHDNMLFNDEKTVFDLNRNSWSADARLEIPRVWLVMMYGAGKIDDNYFQTADKDMKYEGYEAKLMISIIPDRLQLGLRYDIYTFKLLESGLATDQKNITFGINLVPVDNMRIQVNYVLKETDNRVEPDLGDNILFLNLRYSFNASLI